MKKETATLDGDKLTIIEYQEDDRNNELLCKLSGCLLLFVCLGIIAATLFLLAVK